MKKVLFMAVAAFMLVALSQSCKKKISDADLAANITKALADKGMKGTTVTVDKGKVTMSGSCENEKCKADCEAIVKGVKGVKAEDVTNNCTVTPPPASVTTTIDAKVQQAIKDGLKDLKGITVAFEGNKAVFTGSGPKGVKMKIQQMIASTKVPADVTKVTEQ